MTDPQPLQPSSPTVMPVQASPVPQKPPWPWGWLIFSSIIFGLPGSYLIVWQDLKRIGRDDVANKFMLVGGIIVVLVMIILSSLPAGISRTTSYGLDSIFPIWFYFKYLKDWQQQNPNVARFSWSLVGWGVLGVIISLVLLGFSLLVKR